MHYITIDLNNWFKKMHSIMKSTQLFSDRLPCTFYPNYFRGISYGLMLIVCCKCNYFENPQSANFHKQEKLAISGDPDAQNWIGNRYSNGDFGITQNLPLAYEWCKKAAEHNMPDAQYSLAVMYLYGSGINKDFSMAVNWFKRCANNGYGKWQTDAQAQLALIYLKGVDVKKDMPESLKWSTKAAIQGHPEACYALAMWHLRPRHTAEDQYIAKSLLEYAASKGIPEAQYTLAIYLWRGKYIEHDLNAAKGWAEKAAAQNYSKAISLLETMPRN
ncbi:tetratricopeptide repeat protein [Mesoterricola silvestris]|uniref:Sel1 repeat family protein n=1 Tax=Mesoterricola silvestris TaxID=2927979 RepID=A0AA48KA02_9BACT|nr:SEL1-like repeat protein [Mesoterricola silvestris]BDU72832.1 hypothetical protein METEAL_20060 [Mesoterricola silvestris]